MDRRNKDGTFQRALKEHKSYIYIAILLSIFVAYLPVAPIVYMRLVFGPVINSQSIEFLLALAFLLTFALTVNGILEWIRERVLLSGTISFICTLEEKVFSSTFEQTTNKWNDGAKAFSQMRILRNFMVSPVSGAILDAPFSLLLLLVIFFIHPLMGLFSLTGVLIALIIGLLIEKKVQPDQEIASEVQNETRRELNAFHNNSLYCNSMGNLPYIFKRWMSKQKKFLVYQARASSVQSIGSTVSQVIMMVQGSLLLGMGTFLTLIGAMDMRMAGNLIIAKFIGALAIRPTMMIVMQWSQVIAVRESIKELKVFLDTSSSKKETTIKLPPPKGNLVVSDVTFQRNENEKKILDTITFNLNPGNICAVLGESGAGKSTLARLIVGFIKPTRGSIRLDGVSISTWEKKDLCDSIGYLPQDLQLFGGDVVTNITRYREVDNESLKKVCMDFDLDDIYRAYENNDPVSLSDDLFDIPGGKKQKIALARAFYKNPNFIVLDEPTSSLGADFEDSFLNLLKEHKDRGASIIINTHNKRILTMADYILVINDGRQKLFDSKHNIKKKMNLPL